MWGEGGEDIHDGGLVEVYRLPPEQLLTNAKESELVNFLGKCLSTRR